MMDGVPHPAFWLKIPSMYVDAVIIHLFLLLHNPHSSLLCTFLHVDARTASGNSLSQVSASTSIHEHDKADSKMADATPMAAEAGAVDEDSKPKKKKQKREPKKESEYGEATDGGASQSARRRVTSKQQPKISEGTIVEQSTTSSSSTDTWPSSAVPPSIEEQIMILQHCGQLRTLQENFILETFLPKGP